MDQSALRAVVVGTGFGCRVQLPALRAAGFEVAGLVGADAQRTQERAAANGVAGAFTDLDEAIAQTGASAVAVAVPPHLHGPMVLAALAHGCHVICEKPFARDIAEARTMLDAAEATGVVHLVGHEFRWLPERAMLVRLVADGAIGEPRLTTFLSFIPYLIDPNIDMPAWWFDEAAGGGWVGSASPHAIDQVRTLFGEFESLSASTQTLRPGGDGADDTFQFRFRMANGVEGIMQQCAAAWGPPIDTVRIVGSTGTLWAEGTAIHLADRAGTRIVPIADDLLLPPPPPPSTDPRQQSAKWQMLTQIELAPYHRLCQAFRARIEGSDVPREPAVPTFADGVACMAVMDAVRLSSVSGGALVRVGRD